MKKTVDEMTDEERRRLFPVILTRHRTIWGKRYLEESNKIIQAIGAENVARISHIGSTPVPGLIAKPTIDILLEINEKTDINSLITNMQQAGYRHLEQPKKPLPKMMFVKGYTEKGFKGQAFHVHVRYWGDWDELYFRDYLLAHPETAKEYGRLKRQLKPEYEFDRDGYTDAKTGFITGICKLARQEWPGKYH